MDTTFSVLFLFLLSLNVNVAILSPSCSPRIFNFIVFNSLHFTISNSKDTMIKFCSASSSENSLFIELESQLVCLNCNRYGLLVNCCSKSLLTIWCYISAIFDLPSFIFIFIFARSSNSFIRI